MGAPELPFLVKMVKHNNVIPNAHFHKDWENRVKTWFNQPARKLRRRENRAKKALKVAPRPVSGPVRPVVHCPTVRYNMRLRFGKGFTIEELKEAGMPRKQARTIGIAVDHRKRNKSEESLKANVQRLKEYKSKLVIFPRKSNKQKNGDSTEAELTAVTQHKGTILPMKKQRIKVPSRVITKEMREFNARLTLQQARTQLRIEGTRQKQAREKEEAKK